MKYLKKSPFFKFDRLLYSTAILSAAILHPHMAKAGPQDGLVVGGSAGIETVGPNTTITQSTDRAIIRWSSFDVGANERVDFKQPSSSSITVNRINDSKASIIDGTITANGNIMLLNQNGILFGSGARVDVGGIVASTSDLEDDAAFIAGGDMKLTKPGRPDAKILNQGNITAKEAGLAGLIAPQVENHGVIQARMGKIVTASGDMATIDFAGDGLIQIGVSDTVQKQIVKNIGVLSADGGDIFITAAAARDIADSIVQVSGYVGAKSVGDKQGSITITADKAKGEGDSTVIIQDAVLDVSGRNIGERGGDITVTADNVALLSGTRIDASGYEGLSNTTKDKNISDARIGAAGGDIKIGGDYLGQGDTPTAKNLYVDKDVLVLNDALHEGDAGRTIFWSDDTTQFYGNVYARALGGEDVDAQTWNATGGGNTGNGGFVETSGYKYLDAGGYVDLTASNGKRGTYFLDPTDITIYGNVTPTFNSTDNVIDLNGTSNNQLVLWLDASDAASINASAGAVNQWSDKSGLGNNTTATLLTRPTTGIRTINGLNVIDFDGTDDVLTALDSTSLDITNGLSFFSVSSVDATGVIHGLISKRVANGNNEAYNFFVLGTNAFNVDIDGNGNRFVGSNIVTAGATNYNNVIYDGTLAAGSRVSAYSDGTLFTTATEASASIPNYASNLMIGQLGGNASSYLNGVIGEILLYNTPLNTNSRHLVDQYQSAKWGVALTPPGTGVGEVVKATASDGYSVFTTRYLERLSQSANISLQASNNITLDLQTDTLNLATSGRSLTLTAGNQIRTASVGTITTNNGNISLTGTTGGIAVNHNLTLNSNGGAIGINSPTAIATGATLTLNDGGASNTVSSVISGAGGITKQGSGSLTLTAANTYTGNTTVNAGTLVVSGQPYFNVGRTTTIASGAMLQLLNSNNTFGTLMPLSTVNGSGTLQFAGNSTLNQSGGGSANRLTMSMGAGGLLDLQGTSSIVNGGWQIINWTGNLGSMNIASGASFNIWDGSTVRIDALTGSGTINKGFSGTTNLTFGVNGGGGNFSGTIANSLGTITLTKIGAGTQILSGNNTYTGATTISAGTLQIGNGGTAGTLGTANVINNGNLSFNRPDALTVSNVISGSGSVIHLGTGTTTLTANNTYAGTTTISAGTIQVGNNGTTGTLGSGNVVNNAALIYDRSNAQTVTYSMSGTGSLTKLGTNTLTLTGANTHTGATTVSAGTLQAASTSAFSANSAVTLASGAILDVAGWTNSIGSLSGAGTVTNSNAAATTLTAGGDNTSTIFSGIVQNGTGATRLTKSGTGTMTLSGTNTYTGGTNINGGVLNVGSVDALGTSGTISFGGGTLQHSASNTTDYSGRFNTGGSQSRSIDTNGQNVIYAGVLAGTGSTLTKLGVGTLTLTGANTYTGATTVSAGMLIADVNTTQSALSSSATSIASGATLRLNNLNTSGTDVTVANTLTGLGNIEVSFATGTTARNTVMSGLSGFSGNLILSTAGATGDKLRLNSNLGGSITIGNNTTTFINTSRTITNGISVTGTGNSEGLGALRIDNATLTSNIALSGNSTLGGNSGTGIINGIISGGFNINKVGSNTITLSGSNTYTGSTTVSAGTLRAGSAAAFGNNSPTTVASGVTLDLAGFNSIVGSLSGAGTVTNSNATAVTLTAGGDNTSTIFSGIVQNGTGITALTKVGAGTMTLSGANTYTGATTVSAGTLALGASNRLADTGAVLVNASGATFDLGGFTDTIASITSVVGSTVALGNGSLTTSGAQNYGGQLIGGNVTLTSTGGGAITANNVTNDFIGNVNINTTGAVSVVDANALTLGTITGSTIFAQTIAASSDLTLGGNLTASATSGDSIILATGRDLNNSGNRTLNTAGSARWQIYSGDLADETQPLGGLTGYSLTGCNYSIGGPVCAGGTTVPASGNGFYYAFAPMAVLVGLNPSIPATVEQAINRNTQSNNFKTETNNINPIQTMESSQDIVVIPEEDIQDVLEKEKGILIVMTDSLKKFIGL